MPQPTAEVRFLVRWGGPLLGVVALFGFLYRLDGLSLRLWDEGRLAVSALEMVRSGRWFVVTFGGQPDLWNVKPPLMIWCQAGLIRLLGPTEWAIRLPAALAALATIGLLYWFAVRYLRRPLTGVLAISVLVNTLGFLGEHHGHSGDYDALLTLGLVGFSLSLFLFLETNRPRWWAPTTIGLCIATLTKGVAGLLCLPGVAAYCLLHGRARRVLGSPAFWLAASAWVLVMGAWYGLREYARPGYLEAVWINELGGRFAGTLEKNQGAWYYYFYHMGRTKMLPWFWLLPVVLPFALHHPDDRARRTAWFALCWVLGFLFVISASRTKLVWYANPAYPWLALLVGIGGPRAGSWLLAQIQQLRRVAAGILRLLVRVLLVALVLVPPLITIRHELRGIPRDTFPSERFGYALRIRPAPPAPLVVVASGHFATALRPRTALGGDTGYNAALRFYLLALPRPTRVVPPEAVRTLRTPAWVLTASAFDSAQVRGAFPTATLRQISAYPCYLWALPGTPSR